MVRNRPCWLLFGSSRYPKRTNRALIAARTTSARRPAGPSMRMRRAPVSKRAGGMARNLGVGLGCCVLLKSAKRLGALFP